MNSAISAGKGATAQSLQKLFPRRKCRRETEEESTLLRVEKTTQSIKVDAEREKTLWSQEKTQENLRSGKVVSEEEKSTPSRKISTLSQEKGRLSQEKLPPIQKKTPRR